MILDMGLILLALGELALCTIQIRSEVLGDPGPS